MLDSILDYPTLPLHGCPEDSLGLTTWLGAAASGNPKAGSNSEAHWSGPKGATGDVAAGPPPLAMIRITPHGTA